MCYAGTFDKKKHGLEAFRKMRHLHQRKCECITCRKDVTVTVTGYGNKKVAICPKCNKLAYSKKGR